MTTITITIRRITIRGITMIINLITILMASIIILIIILPIEPNGVKRIINSFMDRLLPVRKKEKNYNGDANGN